MAKKSLFGKIADALRDSDEESPEDIDKDVEAAVDEIDRQVVSSLDGETVLHSSVGQAGDTVYIMDLNPIFAMIGGVNGRAAYGVLECCEQEFARHRNDPLDRGVVEKTKFIMHFTGLDDEEGLRLSAIIVNAIGFHVLSDRFKEMEVPEILIAADAGDITNEDGTLNEGKLDKAIAMGGMPITTEPSDDDPVWVKLRYQKKVKELKMLEIKTGRDSEHGDPEWISANNLSTQRKLKPRSGRDRRHKQAAFEGKDQRHGLLERRGRGY